MARRLKPEVQGTSEALVAALTPLARIMLKGGVGPGQLIQAAKLAYLHAAIREVIPKGRKPNVSRLAVVTGFTRKEIAALLHREGKKQSSPSPKKSLQQRALRVLHGWSVDPLFQRADGRPADLPLRGEPQSFYALVKQHGGDVTPVSVLRELERMNAVTTAASGKLKYHRPTAASKADVAQQMAEFARLFKDFANTLGQLAEPREPPLFFGFKDARVDSPQQAALFQRTFVKRAASLLESMDSWVEHQAEAGKDKSSVSKAKTRVGLGIYLMQDDE